MVKLLQLEKLKRSVIPGESHVIKERYCRFLSESSGQFISVRLYLEQGSA